MTIQEQANAILERTDTDELMLRLVQDRAALLDALKWDAEQLFAILCSDFGGDIPTRIISAQPYVAAIRRAVAQAERP